MMNMYAQRILPWVSSVGHCCLRERCYQVALGHIRLITTKHTTSSAVPAGKVEEAQKHTDPDPNKKSQEEELDTNYPLGYSPNPTPTPLPKPPVEDSPEMKHRMTFFQFKKDADVADKLPAHEWRGFFQLFNSKGIDQKKAQVWRDYLGLDVPKMKEWGAKRRYLAQVDDQEVREERLEAVGPELGAAHFVLFRGGRVRFHGKDKWFESDEEYKYDVPAVREDGWIVKDIDLSKMDIVYEGLQNLRNLVKLEYLDLSGSTMVDNWYIDRVCYQHSHSLTSLRISHCPSLTLGGITALVRLPKLRELWVEGLQLPHLALACLELEESLPGLVVHGLPELKDLPITPEEVQEVNSSLSRGHR